MLPAAPRLRPGALAPASGRVSIAQLRALAAVTRGERTLKGTRVLRRSSGRGVSRRSFAALSERPPNSKAESQARRAAQPACCLGCGAGCVARPPHPQNASPAAGRTVAGQRGHAAVLACAAVGAADPTELRWRVRRPAGCAPRRRCQAAPRLLRRKSVASGARAASSPTRCGAHAPATARPR